MFHTLLKILRRLNGLFTLERDTNRTCPYCGGRVVGYESWVDEIRYCEACKRIDDVFRP